MPLDHYGVLVGTLDRHYRDNPDNQGRWYHVNLIVKVEQSEYRCAVDVDSHQSATGVEWKVIELAPAEWATLAALPVGYHELANTSSSGAIDYCRSPGFKKKLGCATVVMPDALTKL